MHIFQKNFRIRKYLLYQDCFLGPGVLKCLKFRENIKINNQCLNIRAYAFGHPPTDSRTY